MTIQRISTPVRVGLPAARHLALIFREQLDIGDRVRSLHAGRTGTVMKVYPDGSACSTPAIAVTTNNPAQRLIDSLQLYPRLA